MSQREIYEWVQQFKGGRTNVGDHARFGQPVTTTCVDVKWRSIGVPIQSKDQHSDSSNN
jgi:hypothetical protein